MGMDVFLVGRICASVDGWRLAAWSVLNSALLVTRALLGSGVMRPQFRMERSYQFNPTVTLQALSGGQA
jgi:hypothetical protein